MVFKIFSLSIHQYSVLYHVQDYNDMLYNRQLLRLLAYVTGSYKMSRMSQRMKLRKLLPKAVFPFSGDYGFIPFSASTYY